MVKRIRGVAHSMKVRSACAAWSSSQYGFRCQDTDLIICMCSSFPRMTSCTLLAQVSPQTSNRMVDGARGICNPLLADVYVFTDHMSGVEAGASPGYGIMLVAETTSGRLLSAEDSTSRSAMVRPLSAFTSPSACLQRCRCRQYPHMRVQSPGELDGSRALCCDRARRPLFRRRSANVLPACCWKRYIAAAWSTAPIR